MRIFYFLPLALCLAGGSAIASSASELQSSIDLLNLPALKSDKAAQSLILDVARTGSRLVAVGERGIIVYSDDVSQGWQQADVPVSVTLTSVAFPTANIGWAAGHDGVILNSQDGGISWRKIIDGNTVNTLVLEDLSDQLSQFEATMDPDNAIDQEHFDLLQIRLEDAEAGASFGPTRPFLNLWFSNETHGFALGAFGQLLETKDGGLHWRSRSSALPNPDSLHLNAMSDLADAGWFISGERGSLWHSLDEGKTWAYIDTGYAGNLNGIVQLDDQTLLTYGFAGNVLLSGDGGATWALQTRFTDKSLVDHIHRPTGDLALLSRTGEVFLYQEKTKHFVTSTHLARRTTSAGIALEDGRLVTTGVGGPSITDHALKAGSAP